MQHTDNVPDLIGLEVASRIPDPPIPLNTLRAWIAQGRLKKYRPGRRVYISRQEFVALLHGEK